VPRFLRTFIALLGCLHLCGGGHGVLQAFAWTRMLVDYSSRAGLAEGAKMTFDGDHPCEMCKALAESRKKDAGKEKDGQQVLPAGLALDELLPASLTDAPTRPFATDLPAVKFGAVLTRVSLTGHRPPVPPPRQAALIA